MNVKIEESWMNVLGGEFSKPYFTVLAQFVRNEYAAGRCYPPGSLIFNAFNLCPFNKVKVVIIGQDPYHEEGQAHGLSFSVTEGTRFPPSLENIFREVHDDTGAPVPQSGDLTRWVRQGVLLLNATLTVRAHQAGSHQGKGWETFTDAAIQALATHRDGIVYMLWGAYAQRKGALIDRAQPRAHVGPSFAAVGLQGLLRQPSFLACQRLPVQPRRDSYRVVARTARLLYIIMCN